MGLLWAIIAAPPIAGAIAAPIVLGAIVLRVIVMGGGRAVDWATAGDAAASRARAAIAAKAGFHRWRIAHGMEFVAGTPKVTVDQGGGP